MYNITLYHTEAYDSYTFYVLYNVQLEKSSTEFEKSSTTYYGALDTAR